MGGNERNARDPVTGNLLHRDFPTRRNVAVVINAPRANRAPGAKVHDHAGRRDDEVVHARYLALRSTNDGLRLRISLGRTIENQKRIVEVYDQQITNRIGGHGGRAHNLSIWPAQDPLWRHVASSV